MNENVNKIEDEKSLVLQEAEKIVINNQDQYKQAGEFFESVNALIKKAKECFDPIVEAAYKAHKQAVAKRDEVIKPLEQAKSKVKMLMIEYTEKIAREAAEAKRKAEEEERKKLEEQRLQQAIELENAGMKEAAEAVLETPVVPLVYLPAEPTLPKVNGFKSRTVWKFKIVNESIIPREYLIVDEVKIGQVVRAMKNLTKIPGVEVYEEKI